LRSAGLVGRDHFAVENGIIDVEHTGHLVGELVEPGHDVAVARDQAIAALLEITEGAEAVVLELEQPVGVVERLFSPGRRDRLHARKGHDPHMGSLTFPGQSALSSAKKLTHTYHRLGGSGSKRYPPIASSGMRNP
jgi:hypothetical protein